MKLGSGIGEATKPGNRDRDQKGNTRKNTKEGHFSRRVEPVFFFPSALLLLVAFAVPFISFITRFACFVFCASLRVHLAFSLSLPLPRFTVSRVRFAESSLSMPVVFVSFPCLLPQFLPPRALFVFSLFPETGCSIFLESLISAVLISFACPIASAGIIFSFPPALSLPPPAVCFTQAQGTHSKEVGKVTSKRESGGNETK